MSHNVAFTYSTPCKFNHPYLLISIPCTQILQYTRQAEEHDGFSKRHPLKDISSDRMESSGNTPALPILPQTVMDNVEVLGWTSLVEANNKNFLPCSQYLFGKVTIHHKICRPDIHCVAILQKFKKSSHSGKQFMD